MASIYRDQHEALTTLLAMASKAEGATLLIPNLQRPYVWLPDQVVALVDFADPRLALWNAAYMESERS